jgi:hypothetical protein
MLSLKQALTAYAEERGVLFKPLSLGGGGGGIDALLPVGARLYSLGGTAAYIAGGVLFLQQKGGGATFKATTPERALSQVAG